MKTTKTFCTFQRSSSAWLIIRCSNLKRVSLVLPNSSRFLGAIPANRPRAFVRWTISTVRCVVALLMGTILLSEANAQSTFDPGETYQLSVSSQGVKKYLAVAGASNNLRQGAKAILWDDVDQDDIRWIFERIGGDSYKIKNRRSGLYMAVAGGSTGPGARIVQWPDVGQRDLTWSIESIGSGNYKLRNRGTRHYLAVSGGRIKNGQDVVQWGDEGQSDLVWKITKDESTELNTLNTPPRGLERSYGYGSLPRSEQTPLLVVLSEFRNRRLDQPLDFYDKLVFGPAFPNVADQFRAYAGTSVFSRAAVIKIRHEHDWQNIPSNFDSVVVRRGLDESGLDINSLDTNRDGKVTKDELAVLSINSNLADGAWPSAQTRGVPTIVVGGKRLERLTISSVHHSGDVNLYVHELAHQIKNLDAVDVYGPGSVSPRPNIRATVMSLHSRQSETRGPLFLDPYHRIRAGWLLPRVHYPTSTRTSSWISAQPDAAYSRAPVILHGTGRTANEFFILEHRAPTRIAHDGGGLPAGLAIWYLQVDSSYRSVDFMWPPPVRAVPKGTGSMGANYIIGVGNTPASGGYWTGSDGEASLNWGDGSDSGIRVRVKGTSGDDMEVEWWRE